MAKWNLDMCYALPISVIGVEADTRDEAIKAATLLVQANVDIISHHKVDAGSLEYDQCTFCEKAKE